jgi:hypothetical protein
MATVDNQGIHDNNVINTNTMEIQPDSRGIPVVPQQAEINADNRINNYLNTNPDLLAAVNNFVEGNFDYVEWYDKPAYVTAWQAITQTESWDYMRNFNERSFMFSRDPTVGRIYSKIEDLGYGGHSGGSFGDIMRIMEYIAIHGERHFMMEYIEDRANRSYRQTV